MLNFLNCIPTMKILLFAAIFMGIPESSTHGKSPVKKLYKSDITLLEAYTQRTLPGRREGKIISTTHFIIVWHNKDYPTRFFWMDNNSAVNCNFCKAHKAYQGTDRFAHNRPDYVRDGLSNENIKPGDTLDVIPIAGNNTDLPHDLPAKTKNTLIYYQSNEKKLFGIKADSLTRKHDIMMP